MCAVRDSSPLRDFGQDAVSEVSVRLPKCHNHPWHKVPQKRSVKPTAGRNMPRELRVAGSSPPG